ncbi:MAG: hypothetical protein R6V45_08040 [Oceanipulchritudo sp.]
MKIWTTFVILSGLGLLLAGCSGGSETDREAADEAPAPEKEMENGSAAAPEETVEGSEDSEPPVDNLMGAHGEGMESTLEKMEKEAEDAGEALADKEESEEPDALSTQIAALKQSFGGTEGMDISDMSWDKVPEIPYADKEKLVGWATEQVQTWKEKLSDSAVKKGTDLLSGMGANTDWEAQLKKVVAAIEDVQEASPETWESARAALLSQWESFKKEAGGLLEDR